MTLAVGNGLVLISGLPGHGKTLYTVAEVEKLRQATGRQVYQHGIKGLTLPWLPLEDPKKWQEVPDGSIVVVDEAWEHFPKRPAGSKVPAYVEGLATHRHRGIDLVLVTQHPGNQLDFFVRGLVGAHYHVRRVFGSARSRLYEWRALGDPNDYHSKKEAVQSWFSFPSEVFAWYKSAEVHTVKRQVPIKPFAIIGGGAIAVALCGWLAWAQLAGSTERVARTSDEASAAMTPQRAVAGAAQLELLELEAASFVPSVPGLPFTAPFYSSAIKADEPPIVAGCGVLKIGHQVQCKCNDQQGNVIDMERSQCLQLFERGMFQPGETSRYPVIEPYVPPLAPPMMGDGAGDQAQPGAGPAHRENT